MVTAFARAPSTGKNFSDETGDFPYCSDEDQLEWSQIGDLDLLAKRERGAQCPTQIPASLQEDACGAGAHGVLGPEEIRNHPLM